VASNYINKGVVRSVIEKIRLCRDRGYARYIPPLKVRGLNFDSRFYFQTIQKTQWQQLNVLNSGGLTCQGKELSVSVARIDWEVSLSHG